MAKRVRRKRCAVCDRLTAKPVKVFGLTTCGAEDCRVVARVQPEKSRDALLAKRRLGRMMEKRVEVVVEVDLTDVDPLKMAKDQAEAAAMLADVADLL